MLRLVGTASSAYVYVAEVVVGGLVVSATRQGTTPSQTGSPSL